MILHLATSLLRFYHSMSLRARVCSDCHRGYGTKIFKTFSKDEIWLYRDANDFDRLHMFSSIFPENIKFLTLPGPEKMAGHLLFRRVPKNVITFGAMLYHGEF